MSDGKAILLIFVASGVLVTGLTFIKKTFKEPRSMYWLGLVGLYLQSLFWVFMFDNIFELVDSGDLDEWNIGQMIGLGLSILPFLVPMLLAWLTAAITDDLTLGIASFTFYSLVQVIVHGLISQQELFTNRLLGGAKLVVPVLSFLVSLIRAMT